MVSNFFNILHSEFVEWKIDQQGEDTAENHFND